MSCLLESKLKKNSWINFNMQKMTKTVVKDETADIRLYIFYKCFFKKNNENFTAADLNLWFKKSATFEELQFVSIQGSFG